MTVRVVAPVGLAKLNAMPFDAGLAEILFQSYPATLDSMIEVETDTNHMLYEPYYLCIGGTKIPVEPTGFIVLAVGVVVSLLRTPNFISHQQHRCSNREESECEEVLDLLYSQSLDVRVGRWTFDAAVPAEIGVRAITI